MIRKEFRLWRPYSLARFVFQTFEFQLFHRTCVKTATIMQIWQMESYPIGDKRLPHHVFPPKVLTPDQLLTAVGVVYFKVDLDDTAATKKRLSRIRNERKFTQSDILTIDENISGLSQLLEDLYEPQESTKEDMVCMVIEGSMYCDIEVEEDEWIRIQLERGDLIVVPKGKSYRYTTTPKNFVRLQRFARRSDESHG